jgi:hypothetical protein
MNGHIRLNDLGYFEARGLNVLAFSNWYDGNFSDAKISGIELIHHEVRTATNGYVRLSPTPGQWDRTPTLVDRSVHPESDSIETRLVYPEHGFQYTIKIEAYGEGVHLSVELEQPLPQELEGRAGFNLEFLPSAYFRKAYLVDGQPGIFPRYPTGPTAAGSPGTPEPQLGYFLRLGGRNSFEGSRLWQQPGRFFVHSRGVSSQEFSFSSPTSQRTKRTGPFYGGRTNMWSTSGPAICSSSTR